MDMGKKAEGTLLIRAYYEGNKVVIQVRDDGKGIDPEKIREVAVSKGVIDERGAANLSDEEAVKLIMAPGFSTAKEISDVSGRGVGMDVVNSSIQAISGTVDIKSEFGVGTTIYIYLPLTLAIVQALVVSAKNEGFAIPIGDINEVIKYSPSDVHKMNEQDVIERRGEALPLFYLSDLVTQQRRKLVTETDGESTEIVAVDLTEEEIVAHDAVAAEAQHEAATGEHQVGDEESQGYVVVVKVGSSGLGVVVDKLLGQEEAVVKAITSSFDYNKAISGATITGDGSVHMILDVPYIIKESIHGK
jgi:two-component system chemotaxis sensor kinase CheA